MEEARSAIEVVRWAFSEDPASWGAAMVANGVIFALGFPLLRAGLTWPGVGNAYILGLVLWRAFGGQGLLVAAIYFCLISSFLQGTGATKVKIKQKEAEGIAEKRSGKRGPASVWGSGSAGIVCALAAASGIGGSDFLPLWKLAFVASFSTKLSDTISSEIGKAYGKTTYLVTNFSIVPRGTEGAVSLEGTAAGLVASILLASAAWSLHEVDFSGAVICVISSQVANFFESYLGATLQGKPGFEWLNNDIVNVLNIAAGATLAILLKLSFM
ncbi:hypothetical protein SELMODRAFT_133256 [Selaginella moellendorffii]|uniref:TIGR00297 family protein n=1 Tax=Selaginella moellendorffii TaxID=88036 RepID=D8T6V7_SELML|nr:hypothetical protein SELMODRAFT_133256 [Selaginella moellendorffii]